MDHTLALEKAKDGQVGVGIEREMKWHTTGSSGWPLQTEHSCSENLLPRLYLGSPVFWRLHLGVPNAVDNVGGGASGSLPQLEGLFSSLDGGEDADVKTSVSPPPI